MKQYTDTPLTLTPLGNARDVRHVATVRRRLANGHPTRIALSAACEIAHTRTRLAIFGEIGRARSQGTDAAASVLAPEIQRWISGASAYMDNPAPHAPAIASDCACIATRLIEARDLGCFT